MKGPQINISNPKMMKVRVINYHDPSIIPYDERVEKLVG